MKNIFTSKVDFTPLNILFSVLAVSFVGFLSDVSAMTEKSDLFRPSFVSVKGGLKTCPVPYTAAHCRIEGKQVNFCEARNGTLLQSLNLLPMLDDSSVEPLHPRIIS